MTPTALQHAPYYAAAALAAAAAGVLLAWWLRRHTMISIRNVYLAAIMAVLVDVVAMYERAAFALPVMAPLTSFVLAARCRGGPGSAAALTRSRRRRLRVRCTTRGRAAPARR